MKERLISGGLLGGGLLGGGLLGGGLLGRGLISGGLFVQGFLGGDFVGDRLFQPIAIFVQELFIQELFRRSGGRLFRLGQARRAEAGGVNRGARHPGRRLADKVFRDGRRDRLRRRRQQVPALAGLRLPAPARAPREGAGGGTGWAATPL